MSAVADAATARLRPGRDADGDGFIRLIGDCFAEYPSCPFDVDVDMPELRALASYFAERRGVLWTAEYDGNVVGMVAAAPTGGGTAWEIRRLYVAASHRRTGLAHRLLDAAEGFAGARGARRLMLWTDTQFIPAHRFYEKRSYVRSGPLRIPDTPVTWLEFGYAKPYGPSDVEILDAAAAASAERCLSDILIACVDAGASVSFRAPLATHTSRLFWHRVSRDVAAGTRLLLAAWCYGVMVGTVQLELATSENQPHVAQVRKLLVDPRARGQGVARRLMAAAEQAALRVGRLLLILDTRSGDPAEGLYRSLGWTQAGHITGHCRDADGGTSDTAIYYKSLEKGE